MVDGAWAAVVAVARGGALDGTLARRPRTRAASCCTRPPSATRRNHHRPPVDGDGVGASKTAAAEAPWAFPDADDGGDGPVVAAVDVAAAAAVADDGGGDVDGNRRRPPRADGRMPSTNRPRWPVGVLPRTRHRCTATA